MFKLHAPFSQEMATADGPTPSKPPRFRTSKGLPHGAIVQGNIAQGQIAPPEPKAESGSIKTKALHSKFLASQSADDAHSSDLRDRLALAGVVFALLFMIFGPYILDMLSAFYQNLMV